MLKPDIEFPGVQIWDDLLDDRFLLDLDEESNFYNWKLGNIANRKSFPYGLKGSHLLWGTKFESLNTSSKNIINLYNYLSQNLLNQEFNIKSIQVNGQSMGQNGTCHTDNPPNNQEYTLMVFINYKWEEKWGGDFQLLKEYDDNAEITQSIKYIPGRIILFDGSIPHRGLAPLKPYIIRKSLVFRLKKI